jgi:DNA-binding transcriptional ArsR family regulator
VSVDVYYIENISQIRAMAEPTRWRMLGLLWEQPMTGSQLARAIHIPRTRAHYHLNILKEVGLVQLQHEQLNGSMVEKYYAPVADHFRTDHLVDRTRQAASQAGDDAGTGEIMRDMMLAIIELARADVLLPQALPGLAQAGFNWQHELLLTQEQTNGLIQALRELIGSITDLSRQNHLSSDGGPLLHLRLTSLLTPVSRLQFDSKPITTGVDASSSLDGRIGERQAHEAEGTD